MFAHKRYPVAVDALAELGAALSGGLGGVLGRTVFKSVGVSAQDWAIMRLLRDGCGGFEAVL